MNFNQYIQGIKEVLGLGTDKPLSQEFNPDDQPISIATREFMAGPPENPVTILEKTTSGFRGTMAYEKKVLSATCTRCGESKDVSMISVKESACFKCLAINATIKWVFIAILVLIFAKIIIAGLAIWSIAKAWFNANKGGR